MGECQDSQREDQQDQVVDVVAGGVAAAEHRDGADADGGDRQQRQAGSAR